MAPDLDPQYAACAKCGSTDFYEAEVSRYRAGMYSSGPGGDLSPVGNRLRVRICLCGHPAVGHCHLPSDRTRLQASMGKALSFRQRMEPEVIKGEIAQEFVSRQEFQQLQESIDSLARLLQADAPQPA
jgi:hypothetical protein